MKAVSVNMKPKFSLRQRIKRFQRMPLFYGLERKLFLIIGAVGILMVALLGIIIAFISGGYLYESSLQLLDNQTRQTRDHLDSYMTTLQNSVISLNRYRSITAIMENSVEGYPAFVAYRDAYDALKSIHDYDNNIEMYIFAVKRNYVMSSKSSDVTSDFSKYNIANADWFKRMMESDGNQHYISDFVAPVSGSSKDLAFVLTVRDLHDWSIDGFLVASLPKRVLDLDDGSNYQFAVWDDNGDEVFRSGALSTMVSEPDLVDISARIKADESIQHANIKDSLYLSTSVSQRTGWHFVSFYSSAQARRSTQALQLAVTIITVICILLVLVGARIISRRTIGPVDRLIREMHKVEENEFSKPINVQATDEIGELIDSLNRLIVSVRTNQILRKRAEIDALQKQMDPHFLFNTLESIRVLSLTGDKKQVAQMIEQLADVFRYNINREGAPIATIAEEIQHIRNYADIQRVRFGERLTVEYDVDESILCCTTLKFILQPIVENAIRHSVENIADNCHIKICAYARDGDIIFTITDNGTGIEPDRLALLRAAVFGGAMPQDMKMGIGLKNIQERLKLFYGSGYGLDIDSKTDSYTTVTVRIQKI